MQHCIPGQFQHANEKVLIHVAAENNRDLNNSPLFIHDLVRNSTSGEEITVVNSDGVAN